MTLPVFPVLPGVLWPVKTSAFSTLEQKAPNGFSTRIAQSNNPIWHWELGFDALRDTATLQEYRDLQGFILALKGMWGDFLYSDPTDNYSGPALIAGAPNPNAGLQLVSDALGNWYSPVQRNFGGQFLEDITDLNGAIAVYVDGVLATQGPHQGQYQLLGPGLALVGSAFAGLYLKWNGFGAPAAPTLAEVAGPNAPALYYVKVTYLTATGETLASSEAMKAVGVAAPAQPTLSAVAGGALAARTAWVKITYVNAFGETTTPLEVSIALAANTLLSVAAPGAAGDATGWNVYVSETASGAEQLQNAAPLGLTTAWTEPTTGLVAGAAPPSASTATAALVVDSPATVSGATGWRVYAGNATGAETLQATLALGTNWTEPSGGLVAGAAVPATDSSAKPAAPVTAQFSFYFRAHMEEDTQDFEQFVSTMWTVGGSEAKKSSGYLKFCSSRIAQV